MVITEDEALQIAENRMMSWRLYKHDRATFTAKQLDNGKLWIAYAGTLHQRVGDDSYAAWQVNVIGDVFYLLRILIPPKNRGKGFGDSLYEIIENIASDMKCVEIRQTPSGWTHTHETRRAYLNRRGWIDDRNEVFKKLK